LLPPRLLALGSRSGGSWLLLRAAMLAGLALVCGLPLNEELLCEPALSAAEATEEPAA
jgi:hypothetical protein